MRSPREQSALVTISDGLSELPHVHLISVRPHPSAHNSLLAEVDAAGGIDPLELRPLAERVYLETGALVLFRSHAARPAGSRGDS